MANCYYRTLSTILTKNSDVDINIGETIIHVSHEDHPIIRLKLPLELFLKKGDRIDFHEAEVSYLSGEIGEPSRVVVRSSLFYVLCQDISLEKGFRLIASFDNREINLLRQIKNYINIK